MSSTALRTDFVASSRELVSQLDYHRFRKLWLQSPNAELERGLMAAGYERMAQQAISEGEYFLAHDAAVEGLRFATQENAGISRGAGFPINRLMVQRVTALARSGALREADRVLNEYLEKHEADSRIRSAQARLFRDQGTQTRRGIERDQFFLKAADAAAQARDLARAEGGDWAYPANQEVQFRFLAGEIDLARSSALAVIDFVRRRDQAESMWGQTNLAEMHLVRGEVEEAANHYCLAAKLGVKSPGDLAANKAVAKLLIEELKHRGDVKGVEIDSWFPQTLVAVFSGHMPDVVGRPTPRLARGLCGIGGPVAQALGKRLEELGATEGVCSSAPGGDILFAEALRERKARLILVETFLVERVDEVARGYGADWEQRLKAVRDYAANSGPVVCAADAEAASQAEYANEVMLGYALLRAQRINAKVKALVLWDGDEGGAPKRGGTGQFVQFCQQAKVPVEVIDPRTLATRTLDSNAGVAVARMEAEESKLVIRSMLFADVVGFSTMPDAAYPRFLEIFLAAANEVMKGYSPLAQNTWGDAIFAVFERPAEAAQAALALQALVKERDWNTELGLPGGDAGLRFRIGLHAGPVHEGIDPMTKAPSVMGRHTNLAARIEPIAEEGQVYSSGEFASLATVEGAPGVKFDYMGQKPLPKKAGVIPVFRVRLTLPQ